MCGFAVTARRRWPLALGFVIVVALVAGCAGKGPVAPVAPPPTPVAARVLDQVPASTPYAFFYGHDLFEPAATAELQAKALALLGEPPASGTVVERVLDAVVREVAPFDAAAVRRAGWLDQTDVAVYGHGLTPIGRVRVDGAATLALWRRAVARAAVDVPERRWHDHVYVMLPAGDDGLLLVIMFLPDQVAFALTSAPVDMLPVLADTAPAARPLMAAWRDAHVDDDPTLVPFMWLAPAAAAAQLRAGDVGTSKLTPACARAFGDIAATWPRVTGAFHREADGWLMSFHAEMPDALRELLLAGTAAHWLPDGPPLQFAWRAPGERLAGAVQALAAPVVAAVAICDGTPAEPLELGALGPLPLIRGGAAVVDLDGDAASVAVLLEAADPGRLWAALQGLLPLGTFPRASEVRTISTPRGALYAIASAHEVGLAMGGRDAARLLQLARAAPHRSALALHFDGRPWATASMLGASFAAMARPWIVDVEADDRGVTIRLRSFAEASR